MVKLYLNQVNVILLCSLYLSRKKSVKLVTLNAKLFLSVRECFKDLKLNDIKYIVTI